MRRVLKVVIAGLTLATTALVAGAALPAGATTEGPSTHGHHATAPAIWSGSVPGHVGYVSPSPGSMIPIQMLNSANGATAIPTAYDGASNSFTVNYGQPVTQPAPSTNWSGYAEQGSFTQASGTWTVPNVSPSFVDLFSSTWVGIDGFDNMSVIQTGTDQNSGPSFGGSSGFDAWYELYPAPSVNLDPAQYPVRPGDVMTANIAKGNGGNWSISLQDSTAHWTYSTTQQYSGAGASAEWIEEAPSDNFGVLPLATFSPATFSNLGVNGSGPPAPPSPPSSRSGYDLVGTDGGVFVFAGGGGSGFYGSLPQMGISVNNVVGMVPSPDDRGYFLVGTDGGVFAFGDSGYYGSLPGLGISVNNVRGIVPTSNNQGYFLVGSDGGVFAFGNAPFLGSLPGIGVARNDIIGIAATPSGQGYWVVAANGSVYAFGNAQNFGSAFGTSSAVSGIASTPDGGGYWIVTRGGAVYTFGDANYYGSLPGLGISPARPVIGLVPTADHQGYWLIGSDGGIFAFGDAPFIGSLPSMGIGVGDIVGAVPTS